MAKPINIDVQATLLALEAFSSDSYLVINKRLLKRFGAETAIFLSNLIDKFKYFSSRNMIQEDGSFFLTHEDQEEQTGMTPHKLRKCCKELETLKIVKKIRKGLPAKLHYFLDINQLTMEIFGEKALELDIKNFNNYTLKNLTTIKETKLNKENKEKTLRESGPENNKSVPDNSEETTSRKKISRLKEKIVKAWNSTAEQSGLPKIKKLTSSRSKHLAARLEELPTFSEWLDLFKKVSESYFCCGENDRGWQVDFDWLIKNDTNLIKIIEGKFKDKKKKSRTRPGGAEVVPGKYAGIPTLHYDNVTGERWFTAYGKKYKNEQEYLDEKNKDQKNV